MKLNSGYYLPRKGFSIHQVNFEKKDDRRRTEKKPGRGEFRTNQIKKKAAGIVERK